MDNPKPQGAYQKYVYYARKVYHPLGFHKGYNFPLWVFTCGALMGFVLARFEYFNIDGKFMKDTLPGEQYYYQHGKRRTAIILHLVTLLPAGFLACFQFVPVIRYKAMIFHRINGYVVSILLLISMGSVFVLAKIAVGGDLAIQLWVGVLGTMIIIAVLLAYINIKRLQIDQHRAWMMRAWVWTASIISLRLIMFAANKVIANYYTYWTVMPCGQIWFMYSYLAGIPDSRNPTSKIYPQCTGPNSSAVAAVTTRPTGTAGPENAAAFFHITFGMAGWLATTIHVILLEVYFALTPAESARLRMVSYERQVQAGFRHPEKGGITATRFGDAPAWWNSPAPETQKDQRGLSDSSDHTLDGQDSELRPKPNADGAQTV